MGKKKRRNIKQRIDDKKAELAEREAKQKGQELASARDEGLVSKENEAEFKKLQKEHFYYVNEFNLPYGEYEVNSIVKDVSTGLAGMASERKRMKKPIKGQVTLSDLVLARTVTDNFNPALGRNLVQGNLQVVPQPDPAFEPHDKMVLFFKIFNSEALEGRPSLVADYKFLNQEGVVSRGRPRPFLEFTDPEAATVTFSSIVDLSAMKPGEYQLHVSVVDFHSKKFAVERTRFEIK